MKKYAVAVGNLPLIPNKKSKEAIKYITELEGFVGFHPCYPHGTLCIFKTENNAKSGRNLMQEKGIETGTNITEVYVSK